MAGDHVGRLVLERHVGRARIQFRQLVGIVAVLDEELPLLGIDQNDHVDFVKLQIAAAGVAEGAHDLAIGFAQVGVELFERIVDRSVEDRLAAMREKGARRRDRHLRHGAGRRHRFEIAEMIDHRVAGERAELRGRPMRQRLRLTALKAFDVRRREGLHVVEMAEKIAAPETAPVFAVGHHLQIRAPPPWPPRG